MNPPKIAVLLATYNGEKFIKEQIDSILNQRGVNLILYIRDDGSNDGTLSILELYKDLPFVKILDCKKKTGSAAGNFFKLIELVPIEDFDYVSFSDQDDIWLSDKIITGQSELANNFADLYSSNLISFSTSPLSSSLLIKPAIQTRYDFLFQGASAGCTYVITQSLALQVRNVLKNIKIFDVNNVSHDWLIYAVSRIYGYRWIHDSRSFIFYRQHDLNAWGQSQGLLGVIKKLRLSKSGWYRQHCLLVCGLAKNSEPIQKIGKRLRQFSIYDRFVLALQSRFFRRSHRESLMLAILILLGWI